MTPRSQEELTLNKGLRKVVIVPPRPHLSNDSREVVG